MAATTTRERILDGAMAVMASRGIARLALEDVAQAAGVSRQTVYRYFGSREALLTAAVLREEQAFIDAVASAAAEHTDFRAALEAAIGAALRVARSHPLLDRLLETEPEALLPYLLSGRGPVLPAALPVYEALLAGRCPHLSDDEVRHIADAITRMLISYIVNPPADASGTLASQLAALLLDGIPAGPAQ